MVGLLREVSCAYGSGVGGFTDGLSEHEERFAPDQMKGKDGFGTLYDKGRKWMKI